RYRLIELLDPELTHFEFFLSRAPLEIIDWQDDAQLSQAIVERHPCIEGWPSRSFFNYEYQVVSVSEAEFAFMEQCEGVSVADALAKSELEGAEGLDVVRSLQKRQLIMLALRES
ncbi:MAG: SAM-dependent methyltransferase, partial [Cyanobacteria bacterium J06573_11]